MSSNRQARNARSPAAGKDAQTEQVLDLDRYVPALITFIANKLSRSATVLYQKRFAVNVTEWRILALLAIEPEISAARICHVIGFDKGPVSRTLAAMEGRGLVAIKADQDDARTYSISLTSKGKKVTTLKPGKYLFVISDKASIHDFVLEHVSPSTPKFEKALTTVTGTGTRTIAVTLTKGKWKYYCAPHESAMFGFFVVK